jgi:hypothetical protein
MPPKKDDREERRLRRELLAQLERLGSGSEGGESIDALQRRLRAARRGRVVIFGQDEYGNAFVGPAGAANEEDFFMDEQQAAALDEEGAGGPLPLPSVPGFELRQPVQVTSMMDRQQEAIARVDAARARLVAAASAVGGAGAGGAGAGGEAPGLTPAQLAALQEGASLAGLQFNRTAGGATLARPLYESEARRFQKTRVFQSNFSLPGRSFLDNLRAFRNQFRARTFADGNYTNRGRVQSTRYRAAEAQRLGYYDLAERMAKLRKSTLATTRQIPVTDVTIVGRVGPQVSTVRQLARSLAHAVSQFALAANGNPRDLVSVTIANLPIMTVQADPAQVYMTSIFTGAVEVGNITPALIASPALVNALEAQIEESFQSGAGVSFPWLYQNDLQMTVQIMRFPAANGWSPRVEVEEAFIKSTLRYIPVEVYTDDVICIPVAICMSSLRVMDRVGNVEIPDFELVKLGDDDVEYELFDTRYQTNPHYMASRVDIIQDMAEALMDEAGVTRETLDINSCQRFAQVLGIQIHVIYQEAMCKRLFKFGYNKTRNVTILISNDHAFPVLKPWRLTGNGMPSLWCDECHKCVTRSWSSDKVAYHRTTCTGENAQSEIIAKAHGREHVAKRYNTLWHKKENRPLTSTYCFTCGIFCETPRVAQGADAMEGPGGGAQLEECMVAGHRLMDNVEMGQCTTCDCVFPTGWPDVRDAPADKLGIFNEHKCEMPRPELKIGKPESYYVWDIETMSVDGVHVPIYIYARAVYDESKHYEFEGMDAFCKFVISKEFKETTWIAHNSGGFDSNFVHAWLEDRGIMHSRIPSPTSLHRSLETLVDEWDIRFIDSFCFIPMGLGKIGPAFNLPVHKGDFPHRFSTLDHLGYRGPMPPCDSEDDWYSLSSMRASSAEKAEVNLAKFKAWHAEEALKYTPHTAQEWVYQDQLRGYCKKDCDVLAAALACMRDSFLNVDEAVIGEGRSAFRLCAVDPLQYLTMAQVCQQLYIAGMYAAERGFRIAHIPLPDRAQTPGRVRWLMDEERKLGRHITKGCTDLREWLADDDLPVDGYCRVGRERHVWEYYDCVERGCMQCTVLDHHNARYGCSNREVYNKVLQRLKTLGKLGYRVHVRWSHDDADEMVVTTGMPQYDCMVAQRQRNDGGFYGGRVEVFKPLWQCRDGERINYIDVVSLYPWVCATQRMCTGHPQIYVGARVDRARMARDHPQAYFGYAHVKVRGCADDYFGGVPRKDRETGRLVFDNSEYRVTCFIDELRERVDHGATILEVYEVWHWDELASTTGPMAGYVAYFLRDKMECSGWKALCGREPETAAEKEAICDQLEEDNLGLCRPRPEKVMDNPGGRQLAKLRLNMLWGKFVQTPKATTNKFITGYEDYVKLWFDNQVDKSTLMFRRIRDGLDFMEVRYAFNQSLRAPVNTHYYLGGSCTANARLKLTSMLRQVGPERALYCDTDSVVYVQRPGDEEVQTGEALGHWSSELDEGVWGEQFMALAPKCYMLLYNEAGRVKEKESGILKAKGVTLTAENLKEIHAESMRRIILTEVFGDLTGDGMPYSVQAKTFNIRMDHAGDRSLVNVYGEKVVRCVYSKRRIEVEDGADPYNVHFVNTVPFN